MKAARLSCRPLKMVILGPPNAGKTSLAHRFCGAGPEEPKLLGFQYLCTSVELFNKDVPLQIWDTAGQERYAPVMPAYVRGASIAIVVFDVTSASSWNAVPDWVAVAKKNSTRAPPVLILGNKTDITDRIRTSHEFETAAHEMGCGYMETSARQGTGVALALQAAVRAVLPAPTATTEGVRQPLLLNRAKHDAACQECFTCT